MAGVLACLLLAAAAWPAAPRPAAAAPHEGVGLFGGFAGHKGDVQLATGGVSGFVSAGVNGGVEYQHVFSPELSLAGFAQASVEALQGDAARAYRAASHGLLGVQLRYWEGGKWVGGQLGRYGEALVAKPGHGPDTQGEGWGLGLAGGWEGERWFAFGQLDLASVAYTNAEHGLTGLRLNVGYRWRRE